MKKKNLPLNREKLEADQDLVDSCLSELLGAVWGRYSFSIQGSRKVKSWTESTLVCVTLCYSL